MNARRLTVALVIAVTALVTAAAPAPAAPKPKPTQTIPPPPRVKCAPPAKLRIAQQPWAQAALAPERAWNLANGTGVVVAVIGTGIDGSVPQLKDHVQRGFNVAIGGNYGPADTDCVGTGTFAAGLVAAQRVEGVGFVGVAPGAMLMPIRVARPGEEPTAAGLVAGINAAVTGGAKVITLAVSPIGANAKLANAVQNAIASDVVVVAPSTGDTASDGTAAAFPAAYPKVISVTSTGVDGQVVSKSDTPTGVRVDLAAPGKDLLSLGTRGPGLMVGSGDEYAAAIVAGTAALVRSYYPKLSAAEVTQRLESSATSPGTPVPDPKVGWGVVDPYEAVGAIMSQQRGSETAPKVTLPPDVVADHRADRLALFLIGGIGVAVVLIGIVGAVIVAGRRRGWQAG